MTGLVVVLLWMGGGCNKRQPAPQPPDAEASQVRADAPSPDSQPAPDSAPVGEAEPVHEPVPTPVLQRKVPIGAVMRLAIEAPGLDPDALAATTTGQSEDPRSGRIKVAFCVSKTGDTEEIRTMKGLFGDPEIDAIARGTVSRWRFRPYRVAGEPEQVCSVTAFDVSF